MKPNLLILVLCMFNVVPFLVLTQVTIEAMGAACQEKTADKRDLKVFCRVNKDPSLIRIIHILVLHTAA